MTDQYSPLSPVDVERKLREVVSEITRAEKQLREARDGETQAELDYKAAHRRAILSEDCPKVRRNGSTVDERNAWVEAQCAHEWEQYRFAQSACRAASDHVQATRDVATAVQSIGALVRQAFQVGGTYG